MTTDERLDRIERLLERVAAALEKGVEVRHSWTGQLGGGIPPIQVVSSQPSEWRTSWPQNT